VLSIVRNAATRSLDAVTDLVGDLFQQFDQSPTWAKSGAEARLLSGDKWGRRESAASRLGRPLAEFSE
jgi:hypothetical protein